MSTLEADLYFDYEAWDRYKSPVKPNAAHAATSSDPTSPSPASRPPQAPSSAKPPSNVILNFTLRYTPQQPSTEPVGNSASPVAPPHPELFKLRVRCQPPDNDPVACPSSSAGTKRPREDSTRTGAPDTTPAKRTAKRARRDYWTHHCRWILDAGTCYFAGTSQQVWAHIRAAHPRAQQPIPEPQSDELPCNWNSCEHRGHPDSMRDHWIRTHREAVKEARKVSCPICAEKGETAVSMNAPDMARHLGLIHWGSSIWRDGCGKRFRRDAFHRPTRDHRGACLERFMGEQPGFRK